MAKYCSNCGNKLDEEADVCLKCGKMVKNTNNNMGLNVPEGCKSKIVAAILAFLFGSIGIHNFYLGYNGKAIAQLLLTLVGWIIIVGPIISAVWALVEFIMILTGSINVDANGNKIV